jgi:hypothetical protein
VGRKKYVWKEETAASMQDLNASAAQYRAGERRKAVTKLSANADAIDANIKRADDLQEKGYWLCDDGHADTAGPAEEGVSHGRCSKCDKTMKYIRRDLMTGQEKYESEKKRGEAEKMAEANRTDWRSGRPEADCRFD